MILFETEDYFGRYEFSQPYMLAASDCENVSIAELIQRGGGSLEEFSRLPLGYTTMEGHAGLRAAIGARYRTTIRPAMTAYMKLSAREYAQHGIRMNALAPGVFARPRRRLAIH